MRPLYVSVACDELAEGPGRLTDEVRALLLKKNNLSAVKNLPHTLPMYRGMRVLLCSKLCVRLQLMNGCVCVLEDIIFAEEETAPTVAYAGEPVVLEYLPLQLLLRAVDAQWTLPSSQLPELPTDYDRTGLFLLDPYSDYFTLSVGKADKLHVRRTHFQIVPADTRIVYAAQGESFPAYLADLARPPGMSKEVHWLANYVMLSRATSLESLLILRLCARDELTTGAPALLRDEVARLEELQQTSWAALQRRLTEVLPRLAPETRAVIEDLFSPADMGRLVVEGGKSDAAIPQEPVRRLRVKTDPSRAIAAPSLCEGVVARSSHCEAGSSNRLHVTWSSRPRLLGKPPPSGTPRR